MIAPWVDIRVSPVYGPLASDWPDEPIPPGRYVREPMNGTALIAYDHATEQLVKEDASEATREAIWRHRSLFLDELERLDAPRSQARPS